MNHPRNSTKSAVLWRVIIARSYHKIYHYFVNLRYSAISAPSLLSIPLLLVYKVGQRFAFDVAV